MAIVQSPVFVYWRTVEPPHMGLVNSPESQVLPWLECPLQRRKPALGHNALLDRIAPVPAARLNRPNREARRN